ncbi:uncharacterized protein Gasu_01780 [Galdieria sulphuraria]|uniref:N-acetyltransferase domain-containing protein n=1 Tax=Galdieria sulphuraria TaxID=130081 RepID=M2YAB5_GALSU|nr:uncharacterized protein Gasu_01780 [Galdieria sulphuraria]EME32819.1 hypothetical protein Gasu_01780 [Galdieria sulphuraria]|eukprot:XP_005709339.1 hypothetical protein Gasu_01780 [Galdieria sulphuraria]
MASALQVVHDSVRHRFFVNLSATAQAFLEYRYLGTNLIDFYHTFVPPEGRGTGVAAKLCDEAFAFARSTNAKVKPSCSYVSQTYLPKHPELRNFIVE